MTDARDGVIHLIRVITDSRDGESQSGAACAVGRLARACRHNTSAWVGVKGRGEARMSAHMSDIFSVSLCAACLRE
jgi:hypothetical protein